MKISNKEILNAIQPLRELINLHLPTAVGWPLSKNVKKLDKVAAEFHEYRNKLVAQHVVPNEKNANGGPKLKDELAFNTAMDELLNQENEIDFIVIEVSKFGDVKIPPSALTVADFMFKD